MAADASPAELCEAKPGEPGAEAASAQASQSGNSVKKIAILQSNYIPWKGYFDMIASVDEFILYDDVQFTKNDWRNRNRIKTQTGLQWLSVPVGQDINRLIRDVQLPDSRWQGKHWATICHAYGRTKYFRSLAEKLEPLYLGCEHASLTELNRSLIEFVCAQLGIATKISYSWEYQFQAGQTERLVDLCIQAGAGEYISGPSAKSYLDTSLFSKKGIQVTWFDYSGYPEYPQLWGQFEHPVSVIDLLFNAGPESERYMKFVGRKPGPATN